VTGTKIDGGTYYGVLNADMSSEGVAPLGLSPRRRHCAAEALPDKGGNDGNGQPLQQKPSRKPEGERTPEDIHDRPGKFILLRGDTEAGSTNSAGSRSFLII
jgi:hypothetical protein